MLHLARSSFSYGWPRIVINESTRKHPSFAEPNRILADGKPIRFLRNELLGKPFHTHNMGYPLPALVDWDADDLHDILFPNETNRIYWYKNAGTRTKPRFGSRLKLAVDPGTATLRQDGASRSSHYRFCIQFLKTVYTSTNTD